MKSLEESNSYRDREQTGVGWTRGGEDRELVSNGHRVSVLPEETCSGGGGVAQQCECA